MTTDLADALAADGYSITLLGGEVVQLRYTFRSLRSLEAKYGGLDGALEVWDKMVDKDAPVGSVFTELSDLMAPGLLHVRTIDPDTGRNVRLGADADVCAEQLDPSRIADYVAACGLALRQAFYAGTNPPTPQEAQAAASPGATGTTSPPSLSDDLTASSGA